MSLFNSKLAKKLADGELPEVKVTITDETLINLGAMIILSGVCLFLAYQVIQKLK
ncbi:MAG: hypothetical protein AAFQ94_09215 [Bacteroidota bacterium]